MFAKLRMTGEVIFNGRYISPWLISAWLTAINSWCKARWWRCWLEPRLQAACRVSSWPGRRTWAAGVLTWALCRGHLIAGAACSFQAFQEKHYLVLHTKRNRWRPFISAEKICAGSWIKPSFMKTVILAVGKGPGWGDWTQFPETLWGGQIVMCFEISEWFLNLLFLLLPLPPFPLK